MVCNCTFCQAIVLITCCVEALPQASLLVACASFVDSIAG